MHTVAVFRMERSERRSGIFNNILRCNPVYFLYLRAGIREVRAAVRTKTVLKAYRERGWPTLLAVGA
jgi:hypothetical protein